MKMRLSIALGVLPSLALVAFLALVTLPAGAQGKGPKQLKIGVVELNEVFEGYARKAILEKKVNNLKERFEEQYRKQTQLVERLIEKGKELRGAELKELEARISIETHKRKVMANRMNEVVGSKIAKLTRLLFTEIDAAVAKHARKAGYDFIFRLDKRALEMKDYEEMSLRVKSRDLLFSKNSYDLTATILKELNAEAGTKEEGF